MKAQYQLRSKRLHDFDRYHDGLINKIHHFVRSIFKKIRSKR